jgi:pilus assembly protein CpaB
MGRRTVLLIVAALVAVLGSGMVYLYVKGADDRAKEAQAPVQVLKAVAQIEPGETLAAAQQAGKLKLEDVPAEQRLDGAMTAIGSSGSLVALTRIYPNEQITAAKFGSSGEQDALALPKGMVAISITVSDTGRVAGFVSPGSNVAVFMNGATNATGSDGVRLLLPSVQVIAVGATTVTNSSTTATDGTQTTEQLPKTLFTLAVDQKDAEKIMYASTHGELTFAYLNDQSKVRPSTGVSQKNLFG